MVAAAQVTFMSYKLTVTHNHLSMTGYHWLLLNDLFLTVGIGHSDASSLYSWL